MPPHLEFEWLIKAMRIAFISHIAMMNSVGKNGYSNGGKKSNPNSQFLTHRPQWPRKSLTRACLAVGEAGSHAPLKNVLDQRPGRIFINQLIGGCLVKDCIKAKMLVVQIFCQIHFGLGLMSHHLLIWKKNQIKVHIFWEGHKILRNLQLTFVCMYCRQK